MTAQRRGGWRLAARRLRARGGGGGSDLGHGQLRADLAGLCCPCSGAPAMGAASGWSAAVGCGGLDRGPGGGGTAPGDGHAPGRWCRGGSGLEMVSSSAVCAVWCGFEVVDGVRRRAGTEGRLVHTGASLRVVLSWPVVHLWCLSELSSLARLCRRRIDADGHGHGGVRARLGHGQRARARAWSAVAVGSHCWVVSPLRPPGLAGDAGVGASYYGGADPDPVADAGLGVEGLPSTLPTMVGAL